jgi:hypothetical protein
MSMKYIPTCSIERRSKIYPNCDFWSENLPSGNSARRQVPLLFVIGRNFGCCLSENCVDLETQFFSPRKNFVNTKWLMLRDRKRNKIKVLVVSADKRICRKYVFHFFPRKKKQKLVISKHPRCPSVSKHLVNRWTFFSNVSNFWNSFSSAESR